MLVAGLMSGTSADAIDVALVDIRGRGWKAHMKLEGFASVPYQRRVRERILAVAGGAKISAQDVSQLNFLLGELFSRAILVACRRAKVSISALRLIGSHGQTIHHQAPPRNECGISIRSTLQIGEPAVIAGRTGVTTIADFRPADICVGGQGAPLVPYYDYLTYRHRRRGRIAINVGGIANLTAIPAGARPGDVVAFDTGPGNMLIDQLMRMITGGKKMFDRGGKLAAQGRISEVLIRRILREKFFKQAPPKSTGRELFGASFIERWFPIGSGTARQTQLDALATATAFTAASITDAVARFVLPHGRMHDCFVSGGGISNSFLMSELRRRFAALAGTTTGATSLIRVISTQDAAIPSRAKEAVAFALLAYQTFHGEPSNLPAATGAARPAILGKMVFSAKK